jgi:hypothetical protein
LEKILFKGLVSRDYGGLQIVSLYIYELRSLKISGLGLFLILRSFSNRKMAPIRVRFSPGLLAEAGFHGEHVFREFSCAPAVLKNYARSASLHFCGYSLEQDFTESMLFADFQVPQQ